LWAGVDSLWEQYKPEARKMFVSRDESHKSGARGVRLFDERANTLTYFFDAASRFRVWKRVKPACA